jgi:hypothetical protein
VLAGEDDHARGRNTCEHSGQDAVADLLEHQPNRGPVTDGSRLCLRDREIARESGHA